MATAVTSAWGIEIGQAGLKAIRLRVGEGQTVRATAFDYIPHPKILSQPDAVPAELIEQAVATFLERNDVGSDPIGISVPGHTSLAKFIKLPPVEPGKVSEIVQYEARQQIPFDLDEVVWDYQPIGGGVEESGFMLEAEVGLFAMKRELVYDAMRPLTEHGEEVEVVQIAPLALYNYLSWDVLSFRKSEETPDPPDAEDYYILLDMGADNTTLVVSNGRSIWIRNVPIGGNHFTRALTREMKLTFAKAEHLKCNATRSPDPKSVFQAMRPVFNDFVTEIQRSIGFFGSVNRTAKIKKVIGIGNGFKLAGLQKFLQQNLQYEVERLEHLEGVTGDIVLNDSVFSDNVMTFAVPYGLALQTLQQTRIHTTLLPPEIVVERRIRSKKPWVVAMLASLLLVLLTSLGMTARASRSYSEDRFKSEYAEVDKLVKEVSSLQQQYGAQVTAHKKILDDIAQIEAPLKRRSMWLELMKAVNVSLPREEGDDQDEIEPDKKKIVRIESISAKRVSNLTEWYSGIVGSKEFKETFNEKDQQSPPPSEAGYIVSVSGYHVYKSDDYTKKGRYFVEQTLGENLRKFSVEENGLTVPVAQLGISHPIVVDERTEFFQLNPNDRLGEQFTGAPAPAAGRSRTGGRRYSTGDDDDDDDDGPGLRMRGGGLRSLGGRRQFGARRSGINDLTGPVDAFEEDTGVETVQLEKTIFVLQFAWKPTLPADRPETAEEASAAPASKPAAAGGFGGGGFGGGGFGR